MARQVMTVLTDDLDGGPAHESVLFGIDGTSYEIDLSTDNAKRMRETLAPFLAGARRVPSSVRRMTPNRKPTAASSREQRAAIRAWAIKHKKRIGLKGRIPDSIVAEFNEAHR